MDKDGPTQPFTDPGVASVEAGLVLLDGPDGIAITLTADAAIRTGASLIAAGEKLQRGEEGG